MRSLASLAVQGAETQRCKEKKLTGHEVALVNFWEAILQGNHPFAELEIAEIYPQLQTMHVSRQSLEKQNLPHLQGKGSTREIFHY